MKQRLKKRTKQHITALITAGILLTAGYLLGRCSLPQEQTSEPTAVTYEAVRVKSGDTLWSICREYCPDGMDIREYIYKVQRHGGISAVIYPGQVIEVPIYDYK